MALAGWLAARAEGGDYRRLIQQSVLEPTGMKGSEFGLGAAARAGLAQGYMWTLHGTSFRAPVFDWGMAPAASLTTTVLDLARFGSALLADAGGAGKLVRKETLEEMWRIQFGKPGEKDGFGLGFHMGDLDGHRRAGHGGAVYGFATEFSLLPDEKLGAVVVVTKDFANTVAGRIATAGLRGMLAAKAGETVKMPELGVPLPVELVRRWAGRYQAGEKMAELLDLAGKLSLLGQDARFPAELRLRGTNFVVDGPTSHGALLKRVREGEEFELGSERFRRVEDPEPAAVRPEWAGLIGEYGWDHDILYILEKAGRLYALIEWFEFNRLEEAGADTFRFGERGMYAGETLVFKRGPDGKGTEVLAGNVRFKRRKVGVEEGQTFRTRPVKSVRKLIQEARQAAPPVEEGPRKAMDLVELATLDPSLLLDIRYAGTNNFLGTVFYEAPRAFLQRPAAEALVRAHQKLRAHGFGLQVFDGYRPWSVTKVFWEAVPESERRFVADPAKGSRHNRGAAADVTLYELATGRSVEMTGGYDESTDRSYPSYPGGTSRQRWHRDLLRRTMESEGFSVYATEWWHFDFNGWRDYPIGNLPLTEVRSGGGI